MIMLDCFAHNNPCARLVASNGSYEWYIALSISIDMHIVLSISIVQYIKEMWLIN